MVGDQKGWLADARALRVAGCLNMKKNENGALCLFGENELVLPSDAQAVCLAAMKDDQLAMPLEELAAVHASRRGCALCRAVKLTCRMRGHVRWRGLVIGLP
jgi:hypothetical protein